MIEELYQSLSHLDVDLDVQSTQQTAFLSFVLESLVSRDVCEVEHKTLLFIEDQVKPLHYGTCLLRGSPPSRLGSSQTCAWHSAC